jgi:hypothetical protein
MTSERKFKSDFSKALAEVLLSNEAKSSSLSTVVTIEEIKETYRALCFDDPVVDSDRKCRALALTIANGMSMDPLGLEMERNDKMKLALSDAFVRGVLYTSRRDEVKGKVNTHNTTHEDDYDDNFHYNGEGIVNSTNASQGYAELALVVLVAGPLKCVKILLSNDERGNTWICSFLGTYNGRENVVPKHLLTKENEINQFLYNMNDLTMAQTDEEKKDPSTSSQSDDIHNDNNDDDSMREIFAEESDSDDYDYGDDRYNSQFLQCTNDLVIPVIDPEVLSKPKILSISEIQFRIESLLQELTYSRLAYMSKKLWNAWRVSKTLVELTLALMQFLGDDSGHEFENLAMLYTKPLMVLRDRALDSNYGHDCLDDYLNLIGIFLNSEANRVGTVASKVRQDNLSPSQVIGLSALSSLCTNHIMLSSSKSNERRRIRSLVFNAQNAILDCLEVTRRQWKTANDGWVRVVLALVSILDFVTSNNSQSDFAADFSSPLTAAESQSLIQSGLFRETLLLYTDTSDETSKTPSEAERIAKEHLLRSILIMCAQSPTILFKYASRVPALTNILYSEEFSKANMGDCILWYTLLSNAHDNSESIRFKTTVTKSKEELFDQCILKTIALFSSLQESLRETNNADQKHIFDSIWILYFLQSSPFAIDCWKTVAKRDSQMNYVIAATLQSLHCVKLPQESSSTDKDEKVHNNSNIREKTIINADLVAKIRKGCKYLLLAMEQSETSAKSISMRAMSSKTD